METTIIFNDFANTNRSFIESRIYHPNYEDLLYYLGDNRRLVEAHAYVPVDPRSPSQMDTTIELLWYCGWLVHHKIGAIAGDSYKCDFDVEITLDLMRTAELIRPDTVVLLSGDKDFIPVVLELRQRGIRVEVAAFSNYAAARELILKASEFIDLERYVEERYQSVEDQALEDVNQR